MIETAPAVETGGELETVVAADNECDAQKVKSQTGQGGGHDDRCGIGRSAADLKGYSSLSRAYFP